METINLLGFEANVNFLTFVGMFVCLLVNVFIFIEKDLSIFLKPEIIFLSFVPFLGYLIFGEGIISPWVWVASDSIVFLLSLGFYAFVNVETYHSFTWFGLSTVCQLFVIISFSSVLYGVLCESMYGRIGFVAYLIFVVLYAAWSVRLIIKSR